VCTFSFGESLLSFTTFDCSPQQMKACVIDSRNGCFNCQYPVTPLLTEVKELTKLFILFHPDIAAIQCHHAVPIDPVIERLVHFGIGIRVMTRPLPHCFAARIILTRRRGIRIIIAEKYLAHILDVVERFKKWMNVRLRTLCSILHVCNGSL
jgi:hypothetical protein